MKKLVLLTGLCWLMTGLALAQDIAWLTPILANEGQCYPVTVIPTVTVPNLTCTSEGVCH